MNRYRRSLRVPGWVVEADATAIAEREVTFSEAAVSAIHSYIHLVSDEVVTEHNRGLKKQMQISSVQEMQQLVSQVRNYHITVYPALLYIFPHKIFFNRGFILNNFKVLRQDIRGIAQGRGKGNAESQSSTYMCRLSGLEFEFQTLADNSVEVLTARSISHSRDLPITIDQII